MLEEMKALAREKNNCVLATILDRKPYCSLMAYVTKYGMHRDLYGHPPANAEVSKFNFQSRRESDD